MNRTREKFPAIIGLVIVASLWWLILIAAVLNIVQGWEKPEDITDELKSMITNPGCWGRDAINELKLNKRKTT